MQDKVSRIPSFGTLASYVVVFYVGATAAFLVPFTSPLAAPLAALAWVLEGMIR